MLLYSEIDGGPGKAQSYPAGLIHDGPKLVVENPAKWMMMSQPVMASQDFLRPTWGP